MCRNLYYPYLQVLSVKKKKIQNEYILLLTMLSPAGCSQSSVPFLNIFLTLLLPLLSAVNPNACRATGRGLQPKGVRIKEVADFKVFTKGAGSGELKVSVKGPSESHSCIYCTSLHAAPHSMLGLFFVLGLLSVRQH